MNITQEPIAIIGMAAIFPQAKNLHEYWENIINNINSITDIDFNPLEFGFSAVQQALTDAGSNNLLNTGIILDVSEKLITLQIASQIAEHLEFGGINCVVDTSLVALKMAISELNEYRSDMMITGSFDKGIEIIVLKRLKDAKQDGNHIYAVIKGIGSAAHALQKSYEIAGFLPSSVSLIEESSNLIKITLALHHKIFPPQINTKTRPWISTDIPRRAAINVVGRTNFHVVLEEYKSEQHRPYRLHNTLASILLFERTPAQLLERCLTVQAQLQFETGVQDYAKLITPSKFLKIPSPCARVGFISHSLGEARELLQIIIDFLKNKATIESWEHPRGIYYRKKGIDSKGKVVALFSGQGSQYLNMGREIALNFPLLRQTYAEMDKLIPISNVVFPVSEKNQENLTLTENAQPAIGVFSVALYKILQQAGFKPNFVAGHSFGELTALWAAGVFHDEEYFFLVNSRSQAMAQPDQSNFDMGTMLNVTGEIKTIQRIVKKFPNISIANWNSNRQIVLAGSKQEIAKIQYTLEEEGYLVTLLPVSAAFHTTFVSHAQKPFTDSLNAVTFKRPKRAVYSNITGTAYPNNPEDIQQLLALQMLNPVHFKQEIDNIYAAGGYFFIEFGPKNILTQLVKNILEDKPHIAIALNPAQPRVTGRLTKKVICEIEGEKGKIIELSTDNISGSGASLVNVPVTWKVKQHIRIRLPAQKEKWLGSTIVWIHKKRAGIQFEITPAEQIKLQTLLVNEEQNEHEIIQDKDSDQQLREAILQLRVAGLHLKEYDPYQLEQPEQPELNVPLKGKLEKTSILKTENVENPDFVHQEYLKNMAEYSEKFFKLMAQLVEKKTTSPELLDTFKQSMTNFHENLAKTQDLHHQYLKKDLE